MADGGLSRRICRCRSTLASLRPKAADILSEEPAGNLRASVTDGREAAREQCHGQRVLQQRRGARRRRLDCRRGTVQLRSVPGSSPRSGGGRFQGGGTDELPPRCGGGGGHLAGARGFGRTLDRPRWTAPGGAVGVAGGRGAGAGRRGRALAPAVGPLSGESRLRRPGDRAGASRAPQRSGQHGARQGASRGEHRRRGAIVGETRREAPCRRPHRRSHRPHARRPSGDAVGGVGGAGLPL